MAPRANPGGNGKATRQGGKGLVAAAAAGQLQGHGESGEDSGVSGMGALKRKRSSPPESPAPSKKPALDESGTAKAPVPVPGKVSEVVPGKGQAVPGDARITKQQVAQPHELVSSMLAADEAVVSGGERGGDVDPKNKSATSLENISHGQRNALLKPPTADISTTATTVNKTTPPPKQHFIPAHAGWFSWKHVHQLESLGLPEFFSGKNNLKTPELYKQHRNLIISKYRENPSRLLKVEDVKESVKEDVSGLERIFEFLDHWGLINYQVVSDFSKFLSPNSGSLEESSNGGLQLVPPTKPALASLFQFEAGRASPTKLVSPPSASTANVPLPTLVQNVLQESLGAPAVGYHCNSCQADCSKRRYHCQKQADFDLCPDCYNDGQFGEGMTSTDFLRMDALEDTAYADGGGWSDQETLLLLEALELYGDNWNEIAEHVATKSKAQCILHFIKLPIEDPFLEDMEIVQGGIPAGDPPPSGSNENGNDSALATDGKEKSEVKEETGNDAAKAVERPDEDKDATSMAQASSQNPTETEKDKDGLAPKEGEVRKPEDPKVISVILAAAEAAGFSGPDGLVAFADAGNPVMAQVAFLAAMVGPLVAATAAQIALKSLAEEDPVGYLCSKNSLALDPPDSCDVQDGGPAKIDERLKEGSTLENANVPVSGVHQSRDSEAAEMAPEEKKERSVETNLGVAGVTKRLESTGEAVAESGAVNDEDVPSVARVKTAASVSLASAAVKAKLLADHEEREIQRLVASVIENQLKKLELKLKQFTELEVMLAKECEQVEKARTKLISERNRIMQARGLKSTAALGQTQLLSMNSAAHMRAASQVLPGTSAAPKALP